MQSTSNTTAFIEAEQYSNFILNNLHDGLLPDGFYRNVSDFPNGSTLNIKVVGSATIRDQVEDQPIQYDPIDTSTVTLTITDYIGDGWYINDVLRQDGAQIDALHASRGVESTRAIQEHFESRFMIEADIAQTNDDPNLINGLSHRFTAGNGAATRQVTMTDFAHMKLAFDKAKVPAAGRIAIVDPVVEATLNTLTNLVNVSNNPMFEGMVTEGFSRDHKFVRNIFGWDVYTSTRLNVVTVAETSLLSADGTSETNVIGDIANLFMCILDDATKPMMGAWRQMPAVEGERNKDLARDEYVTRARWGWGAQRQESLGVLFTNPTVY
jgi:hypothetical protein